jgi:HD-like signal output (HDOD) protein/ActR/RegA family two-component response regulator
VTKPQILFVDDEPSVLAGLRRMLWRRHQEWDLHWANSSAEALEHLRRSHVDILVTDMRMAGTDGAALLDQARRLYPGTARLVLSGHADNDAIVAAAGPTQQFLTKPCDPQVLDNALLSAISTLQLMDDPHLRSLIGGQQSLPKPPQIYTELTALTARPNATIDDVARLVERDVATSTEVLKLVNSSFFGLAADISSIHRAVTLLGLDVLTALVLAGNVFTPGPALPPGLDPADIADRGMRACLFLRRIAKTQGWDPGLSSQLALAALLHDVGLLVLATGTPAGWERYQRTDPQIPARARETEAFGCTIGRASAYLLGLWGFSRTIVTTLAEQPLDLADTAQSASPAAVAIATAVQAACHPDQSAVLTRS